MIYTEKTREAALLAHSAHVTQIDKSGFPYFIHLLMVADQAQTEDECIVALLHDICEDISMDYLFIIEEKFGKRIADAVNAITRVKAKETYFEYIDRCKQDDIARKVKLYDLKHNLDEGRLSMNPKLESLIPRFTKAYNIVSEYDHEQCNMGN